jgi:hypothetical protein
MKVDIVMVERNAFLAAREELGRFSDLHDAEMTSLSLSIAEQSLRLSFKAEEFENEVVADVHLTCSETTDLRIIPPPNDDPAFSDYGFPANTLVDRVTIDLAKDMIAVTVQGTYGWSIQFLCGEIVVAH